MTWAEAAGRIFPALVYLWGMWYLHKIMLLIKHKECPTCLKLADAERRLNG